MTGFHEAFSKSTTTVGGLQHRGARASKSKVSVYRLAGPRNSRCCEIEYSGVPNPLSAVDERPVREGPDRWAGGVLSRILTGRIGQSPLIAVNSSEKR